MKNIMYALVAASVFLLMVISVPIFRPVYAQTDDSQTGGGSSDGQQGSSNPGDDLAGKIIVKGGCYLLTKLPQSSS
jgi:hypothetical protein